MTELWNLECEVEFPLHIVNLYRRVMMHEVGCYKLGVMSNKIDCDDPFIIYEFIEQRLHQLPVNQQMHGTVFKIDITNNLDQEMCVTTDHIRIATTDKSAVKAGLCGKYLICKLGVGKSLKANLLMQFDRPKNNDQFRCCMFFVVEAEPTKDSQVLSHIRKRSICKMQTYGTLPKVRFIND